MRVFISSTESDLLDARAELYAMFKKMGIDPVMSEAAESTFEVLRDKNTIETCLINVDKCDLFVLVLSQRYGASLAKSGYGDVSATHLEYQRAVDVHKPIYMYVRDRLAADYAISKKARNREEISYAWVGKDDIKLFDLLDQHSKLTKEPTNTNWYKIFRDSVELKRIIRNDLKFSAAETSIKKLLSENKFPLLRPNLHVDTDSLYTDSILICSVRIKNVGGAPAFNYVPKWVEDERPYSREGNETIDILAPGDEALMTAMLKVGSARVRENIGLSLSYSNVDGYQIIETYDVGVDVTGGGPSVPVKSLCALKKRKFKLCKAFGITIE